MNSNNSDKYEITSKNHWLRFQGSLEPVRIISLNVAYLIFHDIILFFLKGLSGKKIKGDVEFPSDHSPDAPKQLELA